jgi:hypothetical protein
MDSLVRRYLANIVKGAIIEKLIFGLVEKISVHFNMTKTRCRELSAVTTIPITVFNNKVLVTTLICTQNVRYKSNKRKEDFSCRLKSFALQTTKGASKTEFLESRL